MPTGGVARAADEGSRSLASVSGVRIAGFCGWPGKRRHRHASSSASARRTAATNASGWSAWSQWPASAMVSKRARGEQRREARPVVGRDVLGALAVDDRHRPVVAQAFERDRERADLVHRRGQGGEIDAPVVLLAVADEVGHQEAHHAIVGDRLQQGPADLVATGRLDGVDGRAWPRCTTRSGRRRTPVRYPRRSAGRRARARSAPASSRPCRPCCGRAPRGDRGRDVRSARPRRRPCPRTTWSRSTASRRGCGG